jgi:hypothetical protein
MPSSTGYITHCIDLATAPYPALFPVTLIPLIPQDCRAGFVPLSFPRVKFSTFKAILLGNFPALSGCRHPAAFWCGRGILVVIPYSTSGCYFFRGFLVQLQRHLGPDFLCFWPLPSGNRDYGHCASGHCASGLCFWPLCLWS